MTERPNSGTLSTAFPTLTDGQIEGISRYGERHGTEAGDTLFQEGDRSNDFFVVLSGEVKIVENFRGEARAIVSQGAGKFLGELNMFTGQTRVRRPP